MFDRRHEPLNPPPAPNSNEDQGVMAINYRCEPLRLRPGDPADWFSSAAHDDPETPIFRTYPGDPIRLRLVQGSHEEQHSFMVHGLRWRNWRNDAQSPVRNRQTIGISEAFTFEIARPGEAPAEDEWPYGPGDYLYLLGANDDLWLGCWGLVRALCEIVPGELPTLLDRPNPDFSNAHLAALGGRPVRHSDVLARPREILYHDRLLTDPFGLVYELYDPSAHAGHHHHYAATPYAGGPLVLRCRAGEWIEVTLYNGLPPDPQPEPNPPRLPVDVDLRGVSPRVSMHANALLYDVRASDGTNAGHNPDRTVPHGGNRTYRWYADTPGAYFLQDMADTRNHRHHGLVGVLVVEDAGATPRDPRSGAVSWSGARAVVTPKGGVAFREIVVLLQDGLRLILFGNTGMPLGDESDEPEDEGQKGINYRTEPLDFFHGPDALAPDPVTPICRWPPWTASGCTWSSRATSRAIIASKSTATRGPLIPTWCRASRSRWSPGSGPCRPAVPTPRNTAPRRAIIRSRIPTRGGRATMLTAPAPIVGRLDTVCGASSGRNRTDGPDELDRHAVIAEATEGAA